MFYHLVLYLEKEITSVLPDKVVAKWGKSVSRYSRGRVGSSLLSSYIVMGREGEEMGGKNFYKKV